jgi:hypothetical protein
MRLTSGARPRSVFELAEQVYTVLTPYDSAYEEFYGWEVNPQLNPLVLDPEFLKQTLLCLSDIRRKGSYDLAGLQHDRGNLGEVSGWTGKGRFRGDSCARRRGCSPDSKYPASTITVGTDPNLHLEAITSRSRFTDECSGEISSCRAYPSENRRSGNSDSCRARPTCVGEITTSGTTTSETRSSETSQGETRRG